MVVKTLKVPCGSVESRNNVVIGMLLEDEVLVMCRRERFIGFEVPLTLQKATK